MRQELVQVVLLQKVDENLAQQNKRIKQVEQEGLMKELKKQLDYWRAKLEWYQESVKKKQESLNQLESKFAALTQTIAKEKQEIYQENAYSDKHLLSILDVVKRDEQQLDELENAILILITNIEEIQAQQKLVYEKYRHSEEAYKQRCQAYEKILNEVQTITNKLKVERQDLCTNINHKLLREYERKKASYKGKLVVRVSDNHICTGCHVKINMHDWKRMLGGEIVRCEKCGRYIIYDM